MSIKLSQLPLPQQVLSFIQDRRLPDAGTIRFESDELALAPFFMTAGARYTQDGFYLNLRGEGPDAKHWYANRIESSEITPVAGGVIKRFTEAYDGNAPYSHEATLSENGKEMDASGNVIGDVFYGSIQDLYVIPNGDTGLKDEMGEFDATRVWVNTVFDDNGEAVYQSITIQNEFDAPVVYGDSDLSDEDLELVDNSWR